MNFNVSLFFKVNKLVGRNRWLDIFGRAGAEFVIVAMVGWYAASVLIDTDDKQTVLLRLGVLAVAWLSSWLVSIFIASIVQEPRPHVTYPESKLLFQPFMSWKSFPSDHATAAWLTFFLAVMFGLPGMEGLAVLALWVSWGRVYAGLHYPFDIVGGMTVAAFITVVTYNLLLIFF